MLAVACASAAVAPNPYAAARTWCVVRNPLDRALSSFKMVHAGREDAGAALANDWLRATYSRLMYSPPWDEELGEPKRSAPWIADDCHHLPQAAYVWDAAGARTCGRALRFERLGEEFDRLMRSRNVSFAWGRAARVRHHGTTNVTTADLAPRVRALIEHVYLDDFCRLGYPTEFANCTGASGGGAAPAASRPRAAAMHGRPACWLRMACWRAGPAGLFAAVRVVLAVDGPPTAARSNPTASTANSTRRVCPSTWRRARRPRLALLELGLGAVDLDLVEARGAAVGIA